MLNEIKRYIMEHFKQLFSKTKKVPICKHCRHKIIIKDSGWGCTGGKSNWKWRKSICGKNKVKTSPKWCPLRKGR